MNEIGNNDADLLLILQKGFPLNARPFGDIADKLGLSEAAVLEKIESFFSDGRARRMGAVFDSRRLGYKSTLCALALSADEAAVVARRVAEHQGVTHCYERGWPIELSEDSSGGPVGKIDVPRIWFTFAVCRNEFDAEMAKLRKIVGENQILMLPALRRFKIDVVFDARTRDRSEVFPGIQQPLNVTADTDDFFEFTEREKALVRVLDGNIPIVSNPFESIANDVGYNSGELLELLKNWSECGIIRRIALIVRHHKMGFKANGMCVWSVPREKVRDKGRRLAEFAAVTHCYQRPRTRSFPYDLYAMIHHHSWSQLQELFVEISNAVGLSNGRLLCSVKEYKKTSMSYFRHYS